MFSFSIFIILKSVLLIYLVCSISEFLSTLLSLMICFLFLYIPCEFFVEMGHLEIQAPLPVFAGYLHICVVLLQ